jgi:hypothetical protein
MATLKIVVTVDEDGNFKLAGVDGQGFTHEAFDNLALSQTTRVVRLALEIDKANPPELTVKIPADMQSGTVTVTSEA